MPSLNLDVPAPPVPPSQAGRALHDLGLASLFGANLFARVGVHPALARVSDPSERGKVVNSAWRRYGIVNSMSLAAIVTGWAGARAGEARNHNLTTRERALALSKDGLVVATAVSGVAAAVEGIHFNAQSSGGDVAMEDGSTPAPDAADSGPGRTKRVLNVLGQVNLACTAALIAVNAALAQENFRRPPLRRVLHR